MQWRSSKEEWWKATQLQKRIGEVCACGRILHGCHRACTDSMCIAPATSAERVVQGHAITCIWAGVMCGTDLDLRLGPEEQRDTVATSAMSKRVGTMNTICQMFGPAISGGARSSCMPMRMISVTGTFPIAARQGIRVRGSDAPSLGARGYVAGRHGRHGNAKNKIVLHNR